MEERINIVTVCLHTEISLSQCVSVSFNKGDLFSGNQLYVSDVYHNNLFTYIIKFQAGYKLKMKILHLANISWVFICQALF